MKHGRHRTKAQIEKHAKAQMKAMKHPVRGQAKVGVVMKEFKRGTLKSSSGEKVKSRKQAIAIALSEAGLSRKKKKRKK